MCETLGECYSMMLLLLCSGDVEMNPGPVTRSEVLLELDSLPDEPSEQMAVLFHLLKDLQARSVQSARSQAELVADLKSIKAGQKNIETKIGCIQKRLDAVEEKTNALDDFGQNMSSFQSSVETMTTQQNLLQSRLDELEDQSRRDNLLFWGIPDSRESWEQSEAKIKSVLTGLFDVLPDNVIERAHRLGTHSPSKCRPIIVKFSSFKIKENVLSARTKLKATNVTVSEDFSPATRHARKKLIAFAKNQPGAPTFQLRYNKVIINNKHYVYHPLSDSVIEHVPLLTQVNRHPSTVARATT